MEKIKCITNSYSAGVKKELEIPIEDIDYFKLFHIRGNNGTVIQVVTKKELTTSMDAVLINGHYDVDVKDQYGIYRRKYPMNKYIMREIDEPKLSKTLRKMFKNKEVLTKRVGVNPGTPIARSYQCSWKEIKPEEIMR